MQESPFLDLVNDCLRFVTGYFEIICASSPHIYHSALAVAPKNSIVRRLYGSYAHPFVRVVCGVPTSWDASTVATARPASLRSVVWSPCNRFIVITWEDVRTVDIVDSTTLQRLQTLEPPEGVTMTYKALAFSPDSRILTCSSCDVPSTAASYGELYVVSWDLQTGGVLSVIELQMPAVIGQQVSGWAKFFITYSLNGEMVGISSSFINRSEYSTSIFVCNITSGVLMHSHQLKDRAAPPLNIWAHEESFRFATTGSMTITIWEVGFTPGTTPTEVETLPTPDDSTLTIFGFIPTPCRLALYNSEPQVKIMVWDARNSRYLLEPIDINSPLSASLSSDGRFFACSTYGFDVYLWKESPVGYRLHGILVSSVPLPSALLSQNGESIVTFSRGVIQLWRTKSSAILPSSILTESPRSAKDFIVEFSPGGMLAAVAKKEDNMVMVLDLKSGVPQLTINASIEIYGLGITGNTIVVIGNLKVIIWDLPAEDYASGAQVGLEDSSSTIQLCDPFYRPDGASISPDSRHIAVCSPYVLQVYNGSTGGGLWKGPLSEWREPAFSPDGRNIWCVDRYGKAEVWRVGGEREGLELLELTVDVEHPLEGYPWTSSCGYQVTKDWWILGPDGRRLLMLPPFWQSSAIKRKWKGKFLTLLHHGRSEPVILELEVNSDL